jgi:hypothetical protein
MRMMRPKYDPFHQAAVAKKLLSLTSEIYEKVRSERPDEDEHFYLATTWLRRFFSGKKAYQYGERLSDEELGNLSWTETIDFSILTPPNSLRAMSLYMVYKECPKEYLKHVKEYNTLMTLVTEVKKNGTFMDFYKQMNPRIVMKSQQG